MIERLIEWSARNKVYVYILVIAGVAFGIYSLKRVPLDAIPDLSDTQVIIYTEWHGRSPTIIEDQITYPIVTTLLSAPKVKTVRGYSFFGFSFVYVIFEDGTDIYWARSRVLEYLDQVKTKLPKGVSPQLGPDATGVGWVFQYALVDTTGRYSLADLRTFQDFYLRYFLSEVEGVAEVASVGGFVKEYQIDVDPRKLLAYNIPLTKVIKAVSRSNRDVGGRVLEISGREYFIRGLGYIKSIEDIENIPVDFKNGSPIFVKDIARVHLGPKMRRGAADLNGEGEVVGGIVVMRFGDNALEVIKRVKEKLKEIKTFLPEGIEIITVYDRSELIKESINTLKHKLIEESIIVSIVVIIFLFTFRSALVAILILPVGIILSFIPMMFLRVTSNIMSLGGIAIAIGAMIDAAIVMIENAHKWLEKEQEEKGVVITRERRNYILIEAAKQVGKPLFFALLVITVSFLPVFALEAQEGRLFKPLAYTKTFAMFFASLLSVTLGPVLMINLIPKKIMPEEKNPVNRFLIKIYEPVIKFVLKKPLPFIGGAIIILLISIIPFKRIGSEFMPPLNEGDILYMPSSLPGISITEAIRILQIQDRIFKKFPEVKLVFGKVGRAETATDPAPLSMVETWVILKDKKYWRKGMTWDKLIAKMDSAMQFPGMPNVWTMPIKTRIDMLTTGIKTPVGIKIFGPDLKEIQKIGEKIEFLISKLEGVRSVYAERVTGGYFIDFRVKRKEAARYGLKVEDVMDIIESALGGKTVTFTVEGRERYSVVVRYARELRDNLNELKKILIPTPLGVNIPISQVAEIEIKTGPPVVKSENGMLTGWVFVDLTGIDIGTFVKKAKEVIKENLKIPPGYGITFSGQYEYMERAMGKLKIIVPFTLFLVFFLIFMNFGRIGETLIIMLSIPFGMIGSVWYLYLLGYNFSVAVWVGIIALLGIAAQTGVVMLVYIDDAYREMKSKGRLRTRKNLDSAIIYGAVQRVRPKIMTVMAITMGLIPIMWTQGAGADVMKRIAAPMIGGMVTSMFLTLIVIPAIYKVWKGRGLKEEEK
jgi:Cu(I)/Ag(I) efflux system membrane protein CusA/SilA